LLVAVYRVRLAQVRAQVRGRLEERLAERERIARELHDTLLQGIQGLVLRFQAAANRIPAQEPARALMERALERADDVLREGRDRVKDLRASSAEDQDLPAALAAAGKQLALGHTAVFRAKMTGTERILHPIVRDEALLISREALTNAFAHADAKLIDVEILYSHTELRVTIRDDGRGISSEVMQTGGRPGHWGLLGMRERAQKIRATLAISSSPGGGTQIDLRIPAQVAYLSVPVKPKQSAI
jgi:signal transduction histidine kinase